MNAPFLILLLLVVAVPLTCTSYLPTYHLPKLALLEIGTVAITTCVLWHGSFKKYGELPGPIAIAAVGFLCVGFLSLAPAVNKSYGLASLFQFACFFALMAYAATRLPGPQCRDMLLSAMTVTAGIVGAIGILQYTGIWPFMVRANEPISTIGNTTHVAGFYDLAAPIATGVALGRSGRLRVAAIAAICLILGHTFLLGSRGGWLGLIVACAVFAWAIQRRGILSGWNLRRWLVAMGIMGILIALLLALFRYDGAWPLPLAFSRLKQRITLSDLSTAQRIELWKDTARMTMAHPVLGVGIGNFPFAIPEYMGMRALHVKRTMEQGPNLNLMAFSAHSDFLQAFAECGFAGGVVFAGLMVLVLIHAGRLAKNKGDWQSIGLFAGLAASVAHALISSNLRDPASALYVWTAAGLVLSFEGDSKSILFTSLFRNNPKGLWFTRVLMVTGVCAVSFLWAERLSAGFYTQMARRTVQGDQRLDAVRYYEKAVQHAPPYGFPGLLCTGSCTHKA